VSNHRKNDSPSANNYLKVHPAPYGMTPQLIVPFDDRDPEETKRAWLTADAIRAQLDASQPRAAGARYIAMWRQPTAWPANVPRPQMIGFKTPRGSDLRLS